MRPQKDVKIEGKEGKQGDFLNYLSQFRLGQVRLGQVIFHFYIGRTGFRTPVCLLRENMMNYVRFTTTNKLRVGEQN